MGKGIDVANCNGNIDWQQVSKEVDFDIIRAGYGKDNVDESLFNNAHGAQNSGLPIGMYWVSYAYNENTAFNEANFCCNQADKYSISKFVGYDFEYDSILYANKKGIQCTKELITKMAVTFCRQVKARGYQRKPPILWKLRCIPEPAISWRIFWSSVMPSVAAAGLPEKVILLRQRKRQ